MADPITCYMDFNSVHTYLGAAELERVAARHGRSVDWRPVSILDIWKAHDYMPIGNPIAKGRYVKKDFMRTAGLLGLDIQIPKSFPAGDLSHARHLCWRIRAQDEAKGSKLAFGLLLAYWSKGMDLSDPEVLKAVTTGLGIAEAEIDAAATDKNAAKASAAETAAAVEKGVFGAPYMIADGEPFWGHDRVRYLDLWLERQAA